MKTFKITGTIVSDTEKRFYDHYGLEATCPKDIAIDDPNEELAIEINSNGGDVFAASQIYAKLLQHKGKVICKIQSIAASAASVIAMAGQYISIAPTAQIMIHNVKGSMYGDNIQAEHFAEVLTSFNKSIAAAYIAKTKKSEEELLKMMASEKWFTASEALEHGFVDEIMSNEQMDVVAAYDCQMIPKFLINKLKEQEKKKTNAIKLQIKIMEKRGI